MTYSPVTNSVYASPIVAPFTINTQIPLNQTAATATNIGDLEQQGTVVSISDQGLALGATSTSNVTLQQGDTITFNLASLGQVISDQQGVSPRVQLVDSQGNIVADNEGTTAQQQAFLTFATTGLSPGAGNYTINVTPPNITPGGASASINVSSQQGTRLNVSSQLTSGDPSEYYNFSLGSGNNLKLAFDPGTQLSSTRVQLYDSSGNLVADSAGNIYLQSNFSQLTSATGLAATSNSTYSVVISYADGIPPTQNINYNFQLYSGNSYSVDYQTNATAQSANNSAAASVIPSPEATFSTRDDYNTIVETPQAGVNIGWISENTTSLSVFSQLTSFDNADYYNLILQTGDNLKLAFANTTNTSDLRVQILNGSGTEVLADNQGNQALQNAYTQLTSSTGLAATPGQYVVKVSYGSNNSTDPQTYNFQVYSGTTFTTQYTSTASAETYETALLSGQISGGFTAATAAASYLQNLSNGTTPSVITALSAKV
jgi:hypothetical protein